MVGPFSIMVLLSSGHDYFEAVLEASRRPASMTGFGGFVVGLGSNGVDGGDWACLVGSCVAEVGSGC